MLLTIPNLFTKDQVAEARRHLLAAERIDGRVIAGDLVLYPATSLHRVDPVTRGGRVSSFFRMESVLRDDTQRTLLFDLDTAIQRIAAGDSAQAAGVKESSVRLTGV